MGARIELNAQAGTRAEALLFGEFIGTMLLEVSPEAAKGLSVLAVPHQTIGEVITEPQLVLAEGGNVLWQQSVASLEASWSKPFREVLE